VIPQLRRLVWASWGPISQRAARAYVAGPVLSDALRTCHTLARDGFRSTICPWNAAADSWRQVADSYIAAIRGLESTSLDCYLSIKAPAIGFSRELLSEVLDAAQESGIGIHFDSLAPEDADGHWTLIEDAVARHSQVGCTLPARWGRSTSDVERAVKLGLRVRVVRGQWVDPDAPDVQTGKSFLALIEQLAGRARQVAVATHDPALARDALARLQRAGTDCESELLFGLAARRPVQVARAAGVPLRMYVPYGQAWLPYCLSEVRRKPHIVWWIMRDSMLGWTRPTAPRASQTENH
jgi:proline dehydrogenase